MKDMKRLLGVLGIGLMLAGHAVFAAENRALKVDIFGMGPAVDGAAYRVVRGVMGDLVSDGTVDKFIVDGYGFEGGFSVCLELSKFKKGEELSKEVTALFKAIQPNPRTTSYALKAAERCE